MITMKLETVPKHQVDDDSQLLARLFMQLENDSSKAGINKYMNQVLFDTQNFLRKYVGHGAIHSEELAKMFTDTRIHNKPVMDSAADAIFDLIKNIAPYAVNVASPYYVGHMTSAIPIFMVQLKAIVAALNQNVVKLETSQILSYIEKQVLAKIHRLIYGFSQEFYDFHVQNLHSALGCFTDGGTAANVTALWAARNSLLSSRDGFQGIEKQGISAAYRAYGIDRCVVLVSKLGHYSLRKAGGVLGIGNHNIIAVDVDDKNRIRLDRLHEKIKEIKQEGGRTRILAIVGIAGTTETGTVDPLAKLGNISAESGVHFHVDAAWGGPTLMSEKYRHLLEGIELADSVTIDGHKQFYMPMSCGMVYFKEPFALDNVAYQANYIIRDRSGDLGIKSLSGSREANSLILDSALKIMGARGYAILIEHGIETAREFAVEIEKKRNFRLVTYPELNILTYQVCPEYLTQMLLEENPEKVLSAYEKLNKINRTVQRIQKEKGKGFVSRTTLNTANSQGLDMVVLRAVIANPMTNIPVLREVLDEQEEIYRAISSHLEPDSS